MAAMEEQPSRLLYLTNGLLTAFLWAYFFWPERERRQLSIKSILALIFMEAVTFGALRWIELSQQ